MATKKKQTKSKSPRDMTDTEYVEYLEDQVSVRTLDFSKPTTTDHLERIYRESTDRFNRMIRQKLLTQSNIDVEFNSDDTKQVGKRRLRATVRLAEEVQKRFADKYPTLPVAEYFVKLNSRIPLMSYDLLDNQKKIAYAAAIWILDELKTSGQLHLLLHNIPAEEEVFDDDYPDITDSCYCDDLVYSMMWIIRNRNGDYDRKFLVTPRTVERSLQHQTYPETDIMTADRNDPRGFFDNLIGAIHPEIIRRAVARYEEKLYEITDIYLKNSVPIREEYVPVVRQMITDIKQLNALRRKTGEKPKPTNPVLNFNPIGMSSSRALGQFVPQNPADEYMELLEKSVQHEDRSNQIKIKQNTLDMDYSMPAMYLHRDRSDKPHPLDGFSVNDPFETCFAFLYLLDSGSDIPWAYISNFTLLDHATEQLPWAAKEFYPEEEEEFDDEDDIYDDMEDDEAENWEDETDEAEGDFTPRDWNEEEADLYRVKYTDAFMTENDATTEKKPGRKLNFAQVVYELTDIVIPRKIYAEAEMAEDFVRSGFSEGEAKLLELYSTLANTIPSRASLVPALYRMSEDTGWYERETESTEDNSKEINKLTSENKRLRDELQLSRHEQAEIRKDSEQLKDEIEALKKELAELRTLIRNPSEPVREEEVQINVSFPYSPRHRTVVFGGHDSWARAIKPLLTNVRFVDRDLNFDQNLVIHAKTVWIQNNAMSHAYFYKIVNTARIHNVDVQYFSYASAEKCAEQLALYDMEKG